MLTIERLPAPPAGLKLEKREPKSAGLPRANGSPMKTAQIRVYVWSDYVCPFCYLEEPVINRLVEEYPEQILLEWRAFELRPEPIPTLDPDGEYLHAVWNRAVYPMAHLRGMKLRLPPMQPRSRRAFEAAEFARAHGRFSEMHHALFRAFFQEGRDLSSLGVLLQIGAAAGLDVSALRSALETGHYTSKVVADENLAHSIGITGVPAIVFTQPGCERKVDSIISGAQPYELLRTTVERLLTLQPA